jgi:SAM-dependent methyltransferase
MLDPRPIVRAGYDRIAAEYLAARPRDAGDVRLLTELVARVPAGGRVLDAGCGAGVPVADGLQRVGLEVVGLDLARAQLELARRLVPAVNVVQADLTALPFAAAGFDAVVSFYAVIHVPRAEHAAVFAEVWRVLRPGGAALLCLGASDLAADLDPESWLGTPMFWSHFDAATNLTLLREAGFRVVLHRLVPDPMGHGQHLFALVER